jgi:hypothetical protein
MPTYPDGKCRIYSVDNDGVETTIITGLCLENRVLGFTRVFTARSANVDVNRVIRTPYATGFDSRDYLEVFDEGKYEIVMVSTIYDSTPPSLEISLRQLEMFK